MNEAGFNNNHRRSPIYAFNLIFGVGSLLKATEKIGFLCRCYQNCNSAPMIVTSWRL
jgi:hypothetical protein